MKTGRLVKHEGWNDPRRWLDGRKKNVEGWGGMILGDGWMEGRRMWRDLICNDEQGEAIPGENVPWPMAHNLFVLEFGWILDRPLTARHNVEKRC
jgi:hypothetical protein